MDSVSQVNVGHSAVPHSPQDCPDLQSYPGSHMTVHSSSAQCHWL